MAKITTAAAREAARNFVADFVRAGLEWNVSTIESYIKPDFRLADDRIDTDFAPFTIDAVTRGIRLNARPA